MSSLYEGLTTKNPKAADASTVPKGGNVNQDTTRSTTAKGTAPGGREA